MFHTLLVLSFVLSSIRPLFDTEAMLLILEPLTLVSAAIEMSINSVSIGFIIAPLSLVHIALGVDESAVSVSHAVSPEAVIPGSIWPNLNSAAILLILVSEPLTLVDSSIFEYADGSDFSLFAIIDFLDCPVEWLQLLNYVLNNQYVSTMRNLP
jgi:hypothetical protein